MVNEKNARERIIEASIELFSKHGYDAAGIRKIAKEADVNISMINYYFKSKVGILLELSDIFFNEIKKRILELNPIEFEVEERFAKVFELFTNYLRENHKLFKVIILTNSTEKIEFNKLKAERLREIITLIYGKDVVENFFNKKNKEYDLAIIGPSLVGLAFSHFLLKDLIENLTIIEFDDKFYENYPKFISNLFLYGIKDKLEFICNKNKAE